jgi:hypothetical protein
VTARQNRSILTHATLVCNRLQQPPPVTKRGNANPLEVAITQLVEDVGVDVGRTEDRSVVFEAEIPKPCRDVHRVSWVGDGAVILPLL